MTELRNTHFIGRITRRILMFGTVTKWFDDRGYGFIRGDNGEDYFLHKSKLNGEYAEHGYYVAFRAFTNARSGHSAKDIVVVEIPERRKRR